MKKLTLQVEDLRIDSFCTTPAGESRGTVVGEQLSYGGTCDPDYTCGGDVPPTSVFSCRDTCTEGVPTNNDGINCT